MSFKNMMMANILNDMIEFGMKYSPMLSNGMYSRHVATLMNGNTPLIRNCYNHITGHCMNCHAEQHAILSYLRQTPQLRHLTKTFNFSSPMTDKMMWRFKKCDTSTGSAT
jgi:hypothetical protein